MTEKTRQLQTKRIHGNLDILLLVTPKDIYFYSSISACVGGAGVCLLFSWRIFNSKRQGAVGHLVQPALLPSSADKKGEIKINSSMNTERKNYFIS